ncbi:hypothetical protein [Roseovarius salinarum]|uniref:hypothetical protein n=1 Tax=Roseovarius salinarum TaxID=1981892 RepID=UPI000C33A2D6|nr:hypothetical protein [Roseovarius salinarum]
MTRFIAPLVAFLLGGPALALSCLPRDAPYLYQQADAAEAAYVVVHGRLTFDESRLPRANAEDQSDSETRLPARFTGKALSREGFVVPFDRPITLVVECFGVWCPSPESGTEHLAFLRRRDGGHDLVLDPCGGMALSAPSREQRDRIVQCFRGGPCVSEVPGRR